MKEIITYEDVGMCVAMYLLHKKQWSVSKVADFLEASPAWVRKVARNYDIGRNAYVNAFGRSRGHTAESRFRFRVWVCAEAEKRFQKGQRMGRVALELGVPKGTLERWMRKYRAAGEDGLRDAYKAAGRPKKQV